MRHEPSNFIAKDAMKAWRIFAAIMLAIYYVIVIASFVIVYIFEITFIPSVILFLLGLILIFIFVYLIPKLRYRRWRYEIFEQEIYIQRGILIMRRTLIPMIRVQHVDTEQGPILKRFSLATVSISTAATTHEIPALNEQDASELRDRISTLARVEETDV